MSQPTELPMVFVVEDEESFIEALDIGLKRPSLDDVIISLTGHVAEVVSEEEVGGKHAAKRK